MEQNKLLNIRSGYIISTTNCSSLQPGYELTENARILRMPEAQLRQLVQEPYEYSTTPRADEPEWDQLVKFALRKVKCYLKLKFLNIPFLKRFH